MKNLIIIMYLLSINFQVYSQRKFELKGDSLLQLLKNSEDVFFVLNKFNNKEIKLYVLKWLDFEAYFIHLNKLYLNSFNKSLKIKEWLSNHNQNLLIDTVLKTPDLFNKYLDSVYIKLTCEYRKSFLKENEKHLDNQALQFFMKYRIPEAYTLIRQYWGENGFKISSPYFKVMLAMHDTLAIKTYSDYLDTIVKKANCRELHLAIQNVVNEYNYGSVCIDFKLKLLKEQLVVTDLLFNSGNSDGIDCPYNLAFLYPYIFDYYFFKSENLVVKNIVEELYSSKTKGGFPIQKMSLKERKEMSNKVIANYAEFKKVALEYKNKLQKEEEYWKININYVEL